MDSSIQLFFLLILAVIIIEVVLLKMARIYKVRQDRLFKPEHAAPNIEDAQKALAYELQGMEILDQVQQHAEHVHDEETRGLCEAMKKGQIVHIELLDDLLNELDVEVDHNECMKNEPTMTEPLDLGALAKRKFEGASSYLDFYQRAVANKQKEFKKLFKRLNKSEIANAEIIESFLDRSSSQKEGGKVAICPSCGTVEMGIPNAFCIVCSQPGFQYEVYPNLLAIKTS